MKRIVRLTESDIERIVQRIIKEDEMDWAREIELPDVYVGAKFKTPNGNTIVVYETDEFTTSYFVIDGNGRKREQSMATKGFIHMIEAGLFWKKIDDETPINESELDGGDGLDWIKDVPSIQQKHEIGSHEDFIKHGKGTKWALASKSGKKFYDTYVKYHGPFTIYTNGDRKVACQGDRCYNDRDTNLVSSREEAAEYLGVSSLDVFS